jgi:hypothetical protein
MNASRTPVELIAAYRRGAAVLREAIAGMAAQELRARPIAGKMSSLEVLCHIVDADQFMCDRIKRTVAADRPLLMGVNGILYLEALRYHDRDPEADIRMLEAQREQLAADLDRLGESAWSRDAVHSEMGLVTLTDLVAHAVDHLEDHVARIAEKRAALGV